jgi:four helix bundle protein
MERQNDLSERLFTFAIRCIRFLRTLSNEAEYKVIRYQLIKSSTSSGANYEEAQGAASKADFHNKIKISLKEMLESNYWLRILKEIIDVKIEVTELKWLINESNELDKILGTIANKTKKG